MRQIISLIVFLFTATSILNAQVVDPFAIRYQNSQKGGIRLLSNVSVSCTNCAATTSQIPPIGTGQNNGLNASYVDIDGVAGTYMSSSDSLNLPNCSEILWAGLYWSARIGGNGLSPTSVTNYALRNQVRLRVNNGAYVSLTADEILDNTTGHQTYHCFKNITSIVQASGIAARYTIANLVTRTGTDNMYGGWTIVVVYNNVFESMRNLTVFDGLANVSAGNTVNIPLSGFLTPLTGPVNFELGVVSHDGDRGQTGDQLLFNGVGNNYVNVFDALHTQNDVFNSTIARNGVMTPFRNPNFNNTLGHDASVFSPNNMTYNYIGNNTTSANIRITTGGETILTSVVTSVIDVYEPDLRATVYMQDLNGGLVQPGDVLEYTLVGKNIGSDISNGTYMSDTLDPRTTYLPGSISITYGPNLGPKTDAYTDDQAEYDPVNRVIIARIGTGANGAAGGTVVNSPTGADSTVVKFRVTVIDDCLMFQCDPTLDHKAYIFGTGNISGNAYNNGGLSDQYDANGCPTAANNALVINVAGCPPTAIDYNDPICIGETIQFSFPLSTAATYTWTGPNGFTSAQQNPNITNSSLTNAGVYGVAITFSGLDCIIDTTATIVVNPNPTIQQNTITNVNCFGNSTGSVSISGIGTAPFSYAWSNGNATSNPSGLAAGTYSVTMTDSNTCTTTASYTITQNSQLTTTASITSNFNGFSVSCFGSTNGTATISANGGTAPYTYSWSNGNSGPNASGLPAGTVTVTVTDALGCTSVKTLTLTQPTAIVLSDSKVNVSCFGGANASIDLTVAGGVPTYTYLWSNGATTQDLSGLSAGTYTVTVTDLNGCSQVRTIVITQPAAALTATETHVNILCFGQTTGSINLTPTGGTTPYSYSWSNGANTQDLTNIGSGTYTVLVTDALGCTFTLTVILTQPSSALQQNPTITAVGCFGQATGGINVSVSGGTPGYTFNWTNSAITEDITSLTAGTYTLTATDANGCTISTPALIVTQPAAGLSIQTTPTNISCFGGNNGAINATITGGTIPYSFSWSNGQGTEDLTSISVGTYSLLVTDANGCTQNAQVTLTQPNAALTATATATNVNCFGQNTGSINLTPAGGTLPYLFSWNNGQISEDLTAIASGNYTVTITDANGCTFPLTQVVSQPIAPLTLTETHQDALCVNGVTGSIDLGVTGGTAPYLYSWNNGLTTEDLNNLQTAFYTVTVTDAVGCTSTLTVEIQDPTNTISLNSTPSPVSCFSGSNGSIDLTVTGGNPGYTYSWDTGANTQDISNLSAGTYVVNVLDLFGCGAFISTNVSEPATPISIGFTNTNILCFGNATGAISSLVSGGVPGYSYSWNTGATTQNIQALVAGTYSLQITDYQGCVISQSTTLTQPAQALTLSETHQNVSCFGGNNGSIDLSFSGGTGIPSYSWSNGPLTQDLQNLTAGSYTATATDANGCVATLLATITEPLQALTLSQSSQNVSCFNGTNGSVDLTVTGGTAAYTYSWSNGPVTQDVSTLTTGTYTVQVTDANGCVANLSSTITQPTLLTSSITPTNISCFGGSNGSATIAGVGGTLPYSYLWSNGQTGSSISNLPIGTYSCTITDFNGCQSTSTITLTQPTVLAAQIQVTDVLCFGNATGICSSIVTGGVAPYSYAWSSGGSGANAPNLTAGTYTVTVTDANSCSTTATATVTQPAAPLAVTLTGTNNICFAGTSGAVDAAITGGTAPYSYAWNNGSLLEDIGGLTSGNYQITVTDDNNCTANASLVITEPTQIQTQLTSLQNVSCFGGSDGSIDISTSGGTGPYSYTWSNGLSSEDISGLTSGTYTLTVTDQNNCSENFTFTITQPQILAATIAEIQPLCFGYTDGQLTATPTGGTQPYAYAWSNGINSAVNGSIPTGNYGLTVTDANNCVFNTTYFLNEPAQLQVSFSVSDTIGCNPLTVDFVNTSPEQFSCVWETGDGTILNGCNTSYTYPDAGCQDVTLTITSAIGCTNSLTANDLICVLQSPVAGISADPAQLDTSNPTTVISNTSSGAVSYYWNLSDIGQGDFYFQPGFHTFPMYQEDAYSVSLLATAQNGCTDTALLIIPFDNDLILYVPNAFTPDGDDYNNVFKPVLTSIVKEYHLSIYNRWGEILFESYDQAVGWAGFYGDIPVQDGVYTWELIISTDGAEKYVKHGHVTVLR